MESTYASEEREQIVIGKKLGIPWGCPTGWDDWGQGKTSRDMGCSEVGIGQQNVCD